MVPQPQIYFARAYLKNVAAPMSILNITMWGSVGRSPRFITGGFSTPPQNEYDHGIMTIVITEAAYEEDGSRYL